MCITFPQKRAYDSSIFTIMSAVEGGAMEPPTLFYKRARHPYLLWHHLITHYVSIYGLAIFSTSTFISTSLPLHSSPFPPLSSVQRWENSKPPVNPPLFLFFPVFACNFNTKTLREAKRHDMNETDRNGAKGGTVYRVTQKHGGVIRCS